MDLKQNGYPAFWRCIRPEFQGYVNKGLRCPMNEVVQFKLNTSKKNCSIPNQEFFIKHTLTESRRKSRRVESLIQKYSLKLLEYNSSEEKDYDEYLLLRDDFEKLITDIRQSYISSNYLGLMSWLIDRCLRITDSVANHSDQSKSLLNKNRSLLLKTLYCVNPKQFLQCFKA